jgi:hypothetical protein
MSIYRLQTFALLGLLAITSPASAAGEYENINHSFRLYLGGFWPEIDSQLAINSDQMPQPIPPVDVEDLLGVTDSKGAAWGGVEWRFASRHSLELEYFSLNRNGGASDTFSPPLQFGDFYIEAGDVSTYYDTALTRLTYGFSAYRSDRAEFRLKAGLHVVKLDAGVGVSGLICGPSTVPSVPPGCPAAESGSASEDVTAPLPHFGASYLYAMTPKLALRIQAIGFAVEIESIDGSIIEFDADVVWQPWQNFGVGAGFRYFDANVKAGNSELNGEFDFEYLGPAIYVQATF